MPRASVLLRIFELPGTKILRFPGSLRASWGVSLLPRDSFGIKRFPKRAKSATRGPPDGPRGPRVAERSLQDAQDGPKMQNSLIFHRRLKDLRVVAFSVSRRSQSAQEAPKIARRRPRRPKRGCRDGACGPQDGPRSFQDGPRALPEAPRHPRWPQDGPQTP